jgi:hypothetical protein
MGERVEGWPTGGSCGLCVLMAILVAACGSPVGVRHLIRATFTGT